MQNGSVEVSFTFNPQSLKGYITTKEAQFASFVSCSTFGLYLPLVATLYAVSSDYHFYVQFTSYDMNQLWASVNSLYASTLMYATALTQGGSDKIKCNTYYAESAISFP